MHQRQASSYGRPFFYGARSSHIARIQENLKTEPGIGFVPPEFDDLQGAEQDAKEELKSSRD